MTKGKENCSAVSSNKMFDVRKDSTFSRKKRIKKNELEKKYKKSLFNSSKETESKSYKLLLPIKAKDGFIKKQYMENVNTKQKPSDDAESNVETEDNFLKKSKLGDAIKKPSTKTTSNVDLIVYREKKLQLYHLEIGSLSSDILENPHEKSCNFLKLLKLMEERTPDIYITVRKLVMASLLEIFKDLLPSYAIKLFDTTNVKLKKETLQLQQHESSLLSYYKKYLSKLEKTANILKKNKNRQRISTAEFNLGLLAVTCLSELLYTKPYFNFSTNIAKYLVPFLDSKHRRIRSVVENIFKQIFQDDKCGELSLTIVRQINHYIKVHKHSVHSELLSVLLHLRINYDRFEEESKKESDKKNKKTELSTNLKLRKRSRKLKQIEKKLLETKAEDDKQMKHRIATEIMNLLFTTYLRIIKEPLNRPILSVCLEGLAKFSCFLNMGLYQDIIYVINKILDDNSLNLKDQLHCINTAVLLSGKISSVNIDPIRFCSHLYKNLLNVHLGATYSEYEIAMKILLELFIHKYKNLSENRVHAFMKRMSTMALNLHHNGILGIICIMRLIIQKCKGCSILFDTDPTVGDGIYLDQLDDPEYCKAHCTSLWEIVALQRHYNSVVKNTVKNLNLNGLNGNESLLSMKILKLSPDEMYENYNPLKGTFNPSVDISSKKLVSKAVPKNISTNIFNDPAFNIFDKSYFDMFKELTNKNFKNKVCI